MPTTPGGAELAAAVASAPLMAVSTDSSPVQLMTTPAGNPSGGAVRTDNARSCRHVVSAITAATLVLPMSIAAMRLALPSGCLLDVRTTLRQDATSSVRSMPSLSTSLHDLGQFIDIGEARSPGIDNEVRRASRTPRAPRCSSLSAALLISGLRESSARPFRVLEKTRPTARTGASPTVLPDGAAGVSVRRGQPEHDPRATRAVQSSGLAVARLQLLAPQAPRPGVGVQAAHLAMTSLRLCRMRRVGASAPADVPGIPARIKAASPAASARSPSRPVSRPRRPRPCCPRRADRARSPVSAPRPPGPGPYSTFPSRGLSTNSSCTLAAGTRGTRAAPLVPVQPSLGIAADAETRMPAERSAAQAPRRAG